MSTVMETRITKEKEPEVSKADEMVYGEPGAKIELNKEDDSEASPLLRLPGELRNKIYGYLTIDCDVKIRYTPRNDFISAAVDFVYSQTHRTLAQINCQIRQEARSYIFDHGKFWVSYSDLYAYGILIRDAKNCPRHLIVDIRLQEMSANWHSVEVLGRTLTRLCTEGRLDRIVLYSLDEDRSRLVFEECAPAGLIVKRLREVLHSDLVGREVSVEEDFERTEAVMNYIGGDYDSDCDCWSDSNYYDDAGFPDWDD